jgi:molybdopterin-guanine dinucleotide biosynthesis protein A
MFDVEAFILVGGASSRMGTNKARLRFGNETTLERIAKELNGITPNISVVGSRNDGLFGEFRNVPDVHQQWGALGGIHAALGVCKADWAMIIACDLPFISRQLCLRLIQFARNRTDIDAVVPVQPDGRPQPLCALYAGEICLREAAHLIAAGEHTPRALLANVRTRWVQFQELADLPEAEHFFLNVNTPADYERATEILDELRGQNREL